MKSIRALLISGLIVSSVGAAPVSDTFWQPVSWMAQGVQLVGSFHAASNPKGFVWILLHGLGSTKEEWDGFARQLAKTGDGVLIFDLRGHGESTHDPKGTTALSYKDWRTAGRGSPWGAMVGDLDSAVRKLRETYGLEEGHIAIGGASLGANVALSYAAHHSKVPALILLSPGLEYAGIESQKPFADYGQRPLFIAASPEDRYAFASVQTLARGRGDTQMRLTQGPGAAHGVNMFQDPAFTARLLQWTQSLH